MESPNSQLLKYQYSHDTLNGNPLSIMVASGPYTFDSNLEFEPYHVLLEEIVSSKPHYVILVRRIQFLSYSVLSLLQYLFDVLYFHGD